MASNQVRLHPASLFSPAVAQHFQRRSITYGQEATLSSSSHQSGIFWRTSPSKALDTPSTTKVPSFSTVFLSFLSLTIGLVVFLLPLPIFVRGGFPRCSQLCRCLGQLCHSVLVSLNSCLSPVLEIAGLTTSMLRSKALGVRVSAYGTLSAGLFIFSTSTDTSTQRGLPEACYP